VEASASLAPFLQVVHPRQVKFGADLLFTWGGGQMLPSTSSMPGPGKIGSRSIFLCGSFRLANPLTAGSSTWASKIRRRYAFYFGGRANAPCHVFPAGADGVWRAGSRQGLNKQR